MRSNLGWAVWLALLPRDFCLLHVPMLIDEEKREEKTMWAPKKPSTCCCPLDKTVRATRRGTLLRCIGRPRASAMADGARIGVCCVQGRPTSTLIRWPLRCRHPPPPGLHRTHDCWFQTGIPLARATLRHMARARMLAAELARTPGRPLHPPMPFLFDTHRCPPSCVLRHRCWQSFLPPNI